jgi:hypothetical protein
VLHAVGRIKEKAGGILYFLPGYGQAGLTHKISGRFCYNGPVYAAGVKKVQQNGGYNCPVSAFLPYGRICGPGHTCFNYAAVGGAPGDFASCFFFKFIDFRADTIAQTAFNAFFHVPVTGFSVLIEFQGAEIYCCAKGDTPAAPVA